MRERRVNILVVIYWLRAELVILFMSKVKQKELQKLRQEKEKLNQDFHNALKKLIEGQQTMQITLDYCQEYFSYPLQESLEEYSPVHISRQVFEKELEQIHKEMARMPQQQVRMEHFIVLMLKALKVPFEKSPLYMVGLKDMFREMAPEGRDSIAFQDVFRYLVGELIIMKEEEQDTEFHIQFIENKKQDFLLHDNGIKQVYYSNDLKTVLSLDYRESTIKIYDQQMRNISRFSPKKEMHAGRMPQIVAFDYSEMTMRLGVIFADNTIESIHLPHFITQSQAEFESTTLNQLLFPLPKPMKKIVYVHMLNKFLTFSEEFDELYLFDMEKVRLKPEQVQERVTLDTNEMPITDVLEVVPLSTICVIAGNEITFLSENLKDQKYSKFVHHATIEHLKFCEENSTFYLSCLYEKTITMFTINRNRTSFKISSFSINKVIVDFAVFPLFDTVLVVDELHELRLIHQPSRNTYKQQSYGHIVKVENQRIQCCKTGKSDFLVYQTYMLGFSLDKVAIEKEIELNFLDYWHYDPKKEEFYFSLNDQLICFSLLFGDLRKNYNQDSSNLRKHEAFFIAKNTHPFLIDETKSMYELYLKSDMEGENKTYKKKLQVTDVVRYFYDDEMRTVMVVTGSSVVQVRNDSNNSFTTINTVNLQGFPKVTSALFCKQSKYLTFMTSDSLLFQLQNFQTHVSKGFRIEFAKEKNDVPAVILDYHYCSELQVLLVLNSNKELYLFERNDPTNYAMVDLSECLPYKLKGLAFTKMHYSVFKEKGKVHPSVIVCDETGFLLDINLQPIYSSKFAGRKKEEFLIKSFQKETYEIYRQRTQVENVVLSKKQKGKLEPTDFVLQKAHDKQIAIVAKLKVQVPVILTISKDSYLKLWNPKYEYLFSLKLPNLLKVQWNMQTIHTLKNTKSIAEIKQLIAVHYCKQSEGSSEEALLKTKKLKNMGEFPKKYKFQEELPLQIDSKEVEDIIKKEENYLKLYLSSRVRGPKVKFNPEKTHLDAHPWRTRREFVKIYERASPTNKYSKTMPKNLLTLRKSLDMTERKKKKETYETAELILPMLKNYENEKPSAPPSANKKVREKESDELESCIYVKSERPRKRLNELDEIDREFMRKQIEGKRRRVSSRYRGPESKSMTIEVGPSTHLLLEESRYDTIRDIRSVFEQHNKDCLSEGKGRIIKVPELIQQSFQALQEETQS